MTNPSKIITKAIFTVFTVLLLYLGFFRVSADAISLEVDGVDMSSGAKVYNCTTYVPLRALSTALCPGANVYWERDRAYVKTPSLNLSARPGDTYIQANGRMIYVPDGVRLENGVTLVPVRALAKAAGATVDWNAARNCASVKKGSGTILNGSSFYDEDELYWMSRIISAESQGEPLAGKIAVGNVILNRVASSDYPDTIYTVIFDKKWGVQFEPASNGTVYNEPTQESVLAAKLCLDGANTVGNSMYFLNVNTASSLWIVKNCKYVTTIGNHQFYA